MKIILLINLVLLLTACSSKPYVVEYSEEFTGAGNNAVHIVNHGWHTGFVISAAAIKETVPVLKTRFPNAINLEFGWGR